MQSQDLEILKLMVKELKPVLDDVIFVDSSTISLFIKVCQALTLFAF